MAGVRYGSYAVVSGGQQTRMGMMRSHFLLSVVAAVRSIATSSNVYGLVDLSDLQYPVNGVLHFSAPKPEAPTAKALPALATPGLTILNSWSTSLPARISEPLRQPLHLDFSDCVARSASSWQSTNEQKIIEFVSRLEGLTNGQRMYLALLLFSFAQNTGRHNLSGSIVTMGFVPQRQNFEFSVVDCANSDYDPEADYGARRRTHEISLPTLERRFGFQDILVKDFQGIGRVDITNAADRPLAIPRLLALVLAVRSHPERVVVDGDALRIYGSNFSTHKDRPPSGMLLTELRVEDFALNEREKAWLDAVQPVKQVADVVIHGFYAFDRAMMGKWFRQKKQVEKIEKALKESFIEKYKFERAINQTILEARRELREMRDSDESGLISELDESISRLQRDIQVAETFATQYPKLACASDRRGDSVAKAIVEAKALVSTLQTLGLQLRRPTVTEDAQPLTRDRSKLRESS